MPVFIVKFLLELYSCLIAVNETADIKKGSDCNDYTFMLGLVLLGGRACKSYSFFFVKEMN